ncbi:MAG: lipase family protein, partial [Saprospiraceae bacterium]|nr:lipase family protein [Saprospiraceae bacterium]
RMMPRLILLLLLLVMNGGLKAQEVPEDLFVDFIAPEKERSCIRSFNDTAAGVNNINAFFLAKMTELMYLERLDYHLNYLHSDCQPIDTIPSTNWLAKNSLVDDTNFERAFRQRFQHYFTPDQSTTATALIGDATDKISPRREGSRFRYIHKTYTEKAKFLGYDYNNSLDPELMVISTPETIFIIFRGTDKVGKDEWAEWTGTDFRINQTKAGGALSGTKIHTGFWLSFDLIRDDLIATLSEFGAKDKHIWVAGHSLGAALSIVTGVYLKGYGLDVQNIYAYACPRTIGNKAFKDRANELLPNRVQRFEYYKDPVALLWAPGFGYWNVGRRNWYDEEKLGNYKCYNSGQERVVASGPLKNYPEIDTTDKKEGKRIRKDYVNGLIWITPEMLHYHNPQWYVKAAYSQLTEEEKKQIPAIDDTYPYLYYNLKDTK